MMPGSAIVLLVGSDSALLEGLSQSLAALGYGPIVATGLSEARDMATTAPPLIAVVDGTLAAGTSGAEVLGIRLAPGGAIMLYRAAGQAAPTLPPAIRRAVLAELTLPLERHRLIALVQHVSDRARATGRRSGESPPEYPAPAS
jgi:DNA-binding NtrC family response regulator